MSPRPPCREIAFAPVAAPPGRRTAFKIIERAYGTLGTVCLTRPYFETPASLSIARAPVSVPSIP